ncbi:uncharacterized protein LOC119077930 [Bradysia coprophila]|uniref:uncharacterized protein LOC119077930 n=1 Tax=Bradysia coprophila TaxID=38358 RepID=UPI00187DA088|nr:uncharacterized protein LOC119077930 [Bradysia coprophila]
MKAAVCIVVALLAFSQTTLGRPTSVQSRVGVCLADLRTSLQRHVQQLGLWGQLFIAQITITRQMLESSRELCDELLRSNPPTAWERFFFDACIRENDRLAEMEAERIRRELREKVREQPAILGGFLVDFTRCLIGR